METTAAATTEPTTPLPRPRGCQYCDRNVALHKHPLFAYMLDISKLGRKRLKRRKGSVNNMNHCSTSSDPRKRCPQQNRLVPGRVGSRLTGIGAPYWRLRLAIGPFKSGRHAKAFVDEWRDKKRTVERRVAYGVAMANKQGLNVFWGDNDDDEPDVA